jgi:SAM-dependent methyltransferase
VAMAESIFSLGTGLDEQTPLISRSRLKELRQIEIAKYDSDYFLKEYWKEDFLGIAGNRGLSYDDPLHSIRFSLLASAILKLDKFESILDAGCGPGHLVKALQNSNSRLSGLDASPAAIALSNQLIRQSNRTDNQPLFFKMLLSEIDLKDREFDLVTCFDVMEHILFFDIEASILNLFRIADKKIVFSINSDNPYKYHPTILSNATWRAMFDARTGWTRDVEAELIFNEGVKKHRDEYDFYCYKRLY